MFRREAKSLATQGRRHAGADSFTQCTAPQIAKSLREIERRFLKFIRDNPPLSRSSSCGAGDVETKTVGASKSEYVVRVRLNTSNLDNVLLRPSLTIRVQGKSRDTLSLVHDIAVECFRISAQSRYGEIGAHSSQIAEVGEAIVQELKLHGRRIRSVIGCYWARSKDSHGEEQLKIALRKRYR